MKIMTFNIWNYNAPWPQRRQLIVDLINAHQPDAVALQETRHDFRFERGKGQGEQIAEQTGYFPSWAEGQVYAPILRVDEGLTTLTREKPFHVMVRRLTLHPHDREDENQRVCLGVRMKCDGTEIDVFNTHFSLSAEARLTNAREASEFVARESEGRPAVLMGDLNAEPSTPPLQILAGEGCLFRDCWTSVHPSDPGYSYASFDPVRRIDYVLAKDVATVGRAEIVGGTPVDAVYPSDHLGIVVELRPA